MGGGGGDDDKPRDWGLERATPRVCGGRYRMAHAQSTGVDCGLASQGYATACVFRLCDTNLFASAFSLASAKQWFRRTTTGVVLGIELTSYLGIAHQ